MSLKEIEQEAAALPERERADLICRLLDTLSPEINVTDREVLQRDRDMESGAVEPILHEEFVRRVQKERGR